MTDKPILQEIDIWARTADPTDIIKPPQAKVDEGFLFGEKPPHDGHNYYWNLFAKSFVHLYQNGIPVWDVSTEYSKGALTKDGDMIYFALAESQGLKPEDNPAEWDVAFREKARDADKLDGMEPNELPVSDDTQIELDAIQAQFDEKYDKTGGVISGDVNVDGDLTTDLNIDAKGDIKAEGTLLTGLNANGDSAVNFNHANGDKGVIYYDNADGIFRIDDKNTTGSKIWHGKNDGAGSGMNADILRGDAPIDLPVSNATQAELDLRFKKTDHLDISTGASSSGLPIVLNAEGKVDFTMLDSGAYPVDGFTPIASAEYPDMTGERAGAYWVVENVATAGYEFTTGDLVGQTAYNSDLLQYGSNGWVLITLGITSFNYYMLDGTHSLTADFAGGGYKITNIADGNIDTDGATVKQLNKKLSLSGGTLTGDIRVGDGAEGADIVLKSKGTTFQDASKILFRRQNDSELGIMYINDFISTAPTLYIEIENSNNQRAGLSISMFNLYYNSQPVFHAGNFDPTEKSDVGHTHNDIYFREDEYISSSDGADDAGKPIVLNSVGQIDPSMIDTSSFYYVDGFTPVPGTEYPDITGHTEGAFWAIEGVDNTSGYEFTTGDLAGSTVKNGDFIIWGSAGWSTMGGQMNPTLYYKLDGTNPLTADFNGGGNKISNIADGVANNDGVTILQHNTHTGNTSNPHGVTVSQIGAVSTSGDTMNGNLTIGDGTASLELALKGSYAVENGGATPLAWYREDDTISGRVYTSGTTNKSSMVFEIHHMDASINSMLFTDVGMSIDTGYIRVNPSVLLPEESGYQYTTKSGAKNWTARSSTLNADGKGNYWGVGSGDGLTIQDEHLKIFEGSKTLELNSSDILWGDNILWDEENLQLVDFSDGAEDAGKAVLLDSEGKIDSSMLDDTALYYKLDGTAPLSADFNGGGFKISQIADGTEDTDGVTVLQHNTHTGNVSNPHSVTTDQIGAVNSSDGTHGTISSITKLTQAEYDAIVTPSDTTMYLIIG